MATYLEVYNRVRADGELRARVASATAKYANSLRTKETPTQEETDWSAYVLSNIDIPDQKAVNMMWCVCWDVGVVDTATGSISDATISAVVEPIALKY